MFGLSRKAIIALISTFGVVAAGTSTVLIVKNLNDKNNSSIVEENNQIRKVYNSYRASGGDLSYEEWLESIKGEPGSKLLFGIDNPSSSLGINNDVYLNTSSWDVFSKVNGSWNKIGNVLGPQGEQGPQGPAGKDGQNGLSVVSINKTGSDGLVDTYTITYSNNTTSTFTVTNGANGQDGAQGIQGETGPQGQQGIQGSPGTDGHTPIITISDDGYWVVDGNKTTTSALGSQGPQGPQGPAGPQGPEGDPAPFNEQGLDFYLLDDGTYGVRIGRAMYLSTVTIPSTYYNADNPSERIRRYGN